VQVFFFSFFVLLPLEVIRQSDLLNLNDARIGTASGNPGVQIVGAATPMTP